MNSKWTGKDFGITAGISLVYFMITMVVMMSGALTPILWIFMPALIGFFTGIPYLYIVAKEAKPGVVFLMNLIVGVIYFIAGELSNLVIVTLIITTVLAEGVRKVGGYPEPKDVVVCKTWASVVDAGNQHYRAADVMNTEQVINFTIRYRSDIKPGMWVRFRGEKWDISTLGEYSFKRTYLGLKASLSKGVSG